MLKENLKMMQFYKRRNFGELISDTFNFFKIYGRNYFSGFITINGIFLILFLIVISLGYYELIGQLLGGNMSGQQFYFEEYFNQNTEVLILVTLLVFLMAILLNFVNYSFPVLYMKRISETAATSVSVHQMTEDLKKYISKFLIFAFISFIIIIPLAVLVVFLSTLLMLILIGFLLLIFIIPAIINIVNFAFYDYYHQQNSIFTAIKNGFKIQFSDFFKYWGSTAVIYLLVQIISSIFISIPMMLFGMGIFFISPESNLLESSDSVYIIIVMVIYSISILVTLLLMNLIYINTGLMYYDSRKDLYREVQFGEIDEIGKNEE